MIPISFVVPCYNSAAYMDRCIKSLLPAGPDIEIILINDGSTDETPAICDRYAEQYPDVIRVIHQENGGHGEGINQGLIHARGAYFKVVDSDDWVEPIALKRVMSTLNNLLLHKIPVDLLIVNYVYEKIHSNESKAIGYRNVFPVERTFEWSEVKRFRPSQNLLMHSAIYRTELLRSCRLALPKHTFYVDNIFVYHPLPYVRTLYYLDVDFYRYYIGRENQSVNESVMLSRIDQQIHITKIMLESYNLKELRKKEPELARYMLHFLSMMVTICSAFLLLGNTPEHLEKRTKLWEYIQAYDQGLYYKLKYGTLSAATALPGRLGRKLGKSAYRVSQKIYKFN